MVLLLPVASVYAQAQPEAQNSPDQRPETERDRQVAFGFNNYPSLRIGSHLRFDIHVKSQADWRDFPAEAQDSSEDIFDRHRARVALDGRISKYVEYQVEREMRDGTRPWRDLFVNLRPLRQLEIRLGRFKVPFSLEQTTSSMAIDFAYRSLAASFLAPGRDVGVMGHGDLVRNRLKYEVGVFREGGDNARVKEAMAPASQRTIAGRIVSRPWSSTRLPSLRNLEVGVAFTTGQVPEGLNSLRADTIPGDRLAERVYVNGRRRRLGAELQWRTGPLSVQGEVIGVREQRRGQGIDNQNLPDAVQRGWYLGGTWVITGEKKKNDIDPAKPLLQGGVGALEIGARAEALTFGGGHTSEFPLPGPRASRILERKDAAWTLGMNWYLNRFVRVQANLIRERLEEGGSVLPTRGRAWSRTLRVQFQM